MPKREITDPGVIPPSVINAHVPTAFARQALLFPIYSGEYFCLKTYSINRLELSMCLLVWVKAGAMRFEMASRHYTVKAGQLILINCREPHHYAALEDQTEFLWLHFAGAASDAYFAYFEQVRNQDLVISNPSADTTSKISSLIKMMGTPILDEQLASIMIHIILRNLTTHVARGPNADQFAHPLVSKAIDYLYYYYSAPITVKEMARDLDVSQYYLIRLFKDDTGFTPHEYLQRIRLRNAMEMMADNRKTIESIALQCGFNSASHFSRSFRKNTGQTPSEFRESYAPTKPLLLSFEDL